MNPQGSYGYSPQQPQYGGQASHGYQVPVGSSFYPGYGVSSNAIPAPPLPASAGYDGNGRLYQHQHQMHLPQPPAASPQIAPQTPSAQHLASSIPSNLFYNVGVMTPDLADVWPLPSGTRFTSLLDDGSLREQTERLLSRPSRELAQNVSQHLLATQTHSLNFKRSEHVDCPDTIAAQGTASMPKMPSPSNLEMYINQVDPSIFGSTRQLPMQQSGARMPVPPPVISPKMLPAPSPSKSANQSASAPGPSTTVVTSAPRPPSVSTPEIPIPVRHSLQSTQRTPLISTPVPQSSVSQPSTMQPSAKLIFSIRKAAPLSDENRRVEVKRAYSPEIPETPGNQYGEAIKVENVDPLGVVAEEFDPSTLTIKISSVCVETALQVFSDAMRIGGPLYPMKSKHSVNRNVHRVKESRKLAPFSPETSGEHPARKSFLATADRVMRHISQCEISHLVLGDADMELTDADIPAEAVLSQALISALASDAAKLKTHDQARFLPFDKLQDILPAILPTILHGYIIPADLLNCCQDNEEVDNGVYREILNNRILRGAEAAVAALNIMTAPKLPKEIFNDDVIEACIRFMKYHLHQTVYPAFDPLYRYEASSKDGFVAKIKQKRARYGSTKDEAMLRLYSRFEDLAVLFADLVGSRFLEESPLYQLASVGVSAFFVENIRDLQLKSLRLVATIFAKHDKHREVICEDILSSLARLPSSKRNLRTYVISKHESIQMISALILHLVQSIARLPTKRQVAHRGDGKGEDYEATILLSYDDSIRCAKHILSTFFTKCASKGDEDYRPLFENFIVDLLTTVNKPEWPAAESLLNVLGYILLQKFNDKTLDANFRYASIDYLGLIVSRMRKDHLSVKKNPAHLQDLVTKLYDHFSLSEEGMLNMDDDATPNEAHLFQQGLLQYLWRCVPSPSFAANYYLAQWYHDAVSGNTTTIRDIPLPGGLEVDQCDLSVNDAERMKASVLEFIKMAADPSKNSLGTSGKIVVDAASANLISRQFASRRQFAASFDSYFRRLLHMAADNTMQIRIRAIKCISSIIDADGSLMGRPDMKSLVEMRTFDTSAMIRETVIEMIGKYSVLNPQHLGHYIEVLLKRLMDTAPSVRKRAIKVMHDFCVERPDHELSSKICANIIKRISDEDGIKKLVYEVFQSIWFDTGSIKDLAVLKKRVDQIVNVVMLLEKEGAANTEWFEKMLKELLKREVDVKHKLVRSSCQAIVDLIIARFLDTDPDAERSVEESRKIAGSFLTVKLFVTCCPDLALSHAQSLPPFLNQNLRTVQDQQIIVITANILTTVVPSMKNPPDFFLAQVEESCVGLFDKQGVNVQMLQSTVECLGAVVNNVTKNFKIVRDIYERYWKHLLIGASDKDNKLAPVARIQRTMCIVALIIQHFDIDSEEFGYIQSHSGTSDRLVDTFLHLLRHKNSGIQVGALQSLGYVFIRRPDTMLQKKITDLYSSILGGSTTGPAAAIKTEMKKTVLINLVKYLQHEESQIRTIEEHAVVPEDGAPVDLRGNQSTTVELPRRVIFHYLKSILECGFDANADIRKEVLGLVSIIVRLRFSHPQQSLPFLISAATDTDTSISDKSNVLLEEIHRKYHGILATKALIGIRESFTFQKSLAASPTTLIRGFRNTQSGPSSLSANVYALLRSDRPQRRALINSLLDAFKYEDSPLDQLLYFADNIAYFSYQAMDEPLFLMYQIEPILALISPDALLQFKKAFKITNPAADASDGDPDEDDWETADNMRRCLPSDLTELRKSYRICQPSMLLIALKRFLMLHYGVTQVKLGEYLPSEPMKTWEKPIVSRKTNYKYEPTPVCEFVTREAKGDVDFLSSQLLIKKYLEFKTVVQMIDDREIVPEPSDAASRTASAPENDDIEMEIGDEDALPCTEEDTSSGADVSGEPSSSSRESSVPTSPAKKRTADGVFKKPRSPRKKPDPSAKKAKRGRPRKYTANSGASSDEDDETWNP